TGQSSLTVAANWSDIELTRFNPDFVDDDRRLEIERGRPDSRFTATLRHAQDAWRLMGRLRYYGEHYDDPTDSGGLQANAYFAEPRTVFDLEAGYDFSDSGSVVLGLQNAFDEYPQVNSNPNSLNDYGHVEVAGLAYPESSPLGFNGGYYYLRLTWQMQ
ncbi:MAG: TonB-dependent receptor, partial [Rhodospirillaceae bacterium]|nr:TonB-dependent receptor [Rhodospirillaceae bacterium]